MVSRSDVKKYKEMAKAWIDENGDEFEKISKYIWSHPELGLEEYEASRKLTDVLKKYGFSINTHVSGMPTAFIATYGSGKPVIGYNAEYDCLPGLSQKAGSSKKEFLIPGAPGQGCGHNVLGTAGVLGAIVLKQVMEEKHIKGTVKVFGSPAEEICIGKPFMARDGWFDGLDCILDWHPLYKNFANSDFCSAYFNVKYHFHGKTAHVNSPWFGNSTLDAAIWTGHAIEVLREHIRPEQEAYANTINYSFSHVGPEIPNVVPDWTDIWCIGRFRTSEEMQSVMKRIDKCAEAGAMATGTTVEKEFITASREKIPNTVMTKVLHKNMEEMGTIAYTEEKQNFVKSIQKNCGIPEDGLPTGITDLEECGTYVTDSAEYSWKAPLANFGLAVAPYDGWHNWKVVSCVGSSIGMKGMVQASKILAASCMEVIQTPEIIKEAKDEMKERLKGKSYVELIPKEVKPPVGINYETMEKYRQLFSSD